MAETKTSQPESDCTCPMSVRATGQHSTGCAARAPQKTATVRFAPRGDHLWEVDLSDRPAGWPLARANVSREKLERFLTSHGYAVTFAEAAHA